MAGNIVITCDKNARLSLIDVAGCHYSQLELGKPGKHTSVAVGIFRVGLLGALHLPCIFAPTRRGAGVLKNVLFTSLHPNDTPNKVQRESYEKGVAGWEAVSHLGAKKNFSGALHPHPPFEFVEKAGMTFKFATKNQAAK